MYKVIGRDGLEYGPVDEEQVRRWIAERRLKAESRVQAVGSDEWKTVGELPEFQEALNSAAQQAAGPATAPPRNAPGSADQLADEVIARQPHVDIGGCISRGFNLVMADFGLIVGASFVVGLILMVPLIGWLLSGPLIGGLAFLFLKRIRGEQASVSDAFAGFGPQFWQLFLARLVTGVLISIGFMLCIVPGIYLAVAWVFTMPLVIDRKLDFWTAMEVSRKVVHKHWWTIFGLALLAWVIALAGVLACIIGIIVTAPVAVASMMYAYEEMFGNPAGQGPDAVK